MDDRLNELAELHIVLNVLFNSQPLASPRVVKSTLGERQRSNNHMVWLVLKLF